MFEIREVAQVEATGKYSSWFASAGISLVGAWALIGACVC